MRPLDDDNEAREKATKSGYLYKNTQLNVGINATQTTYSLLAKGVKGRRPLQTCSGTSAACFSQYIVSPTQIRNLLLYPNANTK